MLHITFIYADEPMERNCSIWRCLWPVEALRRAGHEAYLFFLRDWLKRDARVFYRGATSDILVYERVLTDEVAEDMRYWKRHGKKIVVDFDDAYQLMPEYIPSYHNWHGPAKGYKEPLIDSLRRNLPLADLLTTPSKLLCDDWRGYAARTECLPNRPPTKTMPYYGKDYPIKNSHQLGWGGSGHLHSWQQSGIVPAIQDEPLLIFWGDEELKGLLPRARFHNKVEAPMWPYVMGRIGIGLAPIAGDYDQRRSWLKCLEYGLKGIPWVASDMPPYQECQGGIAVPNRPEAWKEAIQAVRADKSLYQKLSEEGKKWAWEQDIDTNMRERVSLYESLLEGQG